VQEVEPLLGVPRFLPETVDRRDRVGLATGLAWSEAGGSVLQIEVGILPGRGKLILTGKLGATMRESAQAALSCVRCRAIRLGLDPQFHRTVDMHVHIPEGEVPKDGPSAGAAIGLAMVSALTRVPTKDSVALTGEMTLRGQILPVGGLAEKSLAALRAGVRTVLVPAGNDRHIAELPEEARAGLEFVRVSTFDEVLRHGLVARRLVRQRQIRQRVSATIEAA
jgi:ATP-dependent Lon protease